TRALRSLVRWIEEGGSLARPLIHPVVAEHVVETDAVEERRGAPAPVAPPGVVSAPHDVPADDRQAPVLPLRGEGIRRRTDRGIQAKLVRPGPDVRAVPGDHERDVAEDLDPGCKRVASRPLPLRRELPLHPGKEAPYGRERQTGMLERH